MRIHEFWFVTHGHISHLVCHCNFSFFWTGRGGWGWALEDLNQEKIYLTFAMNLLTKALNIRCLK